MTVYIDNARIRGKLGAYSFAYWSNLTATTQDELHEFAQKIGLKRGMFQDKGHGWWFYNITDSMRADAIKAGAVQVDVDELRKVWLCDDRKGRTPEDIAACTCAFHKN